MLLPQVKYLGHTYGMSHAMFRKLQFYMGLRGTCYRESGFLTLHAHFDPTSAPLACPLNPQVPLETGEL